MDTKSRITFCGTVDYMAPEMLKNKPYDKSLDVWCLGVLLYELLHGGPPFKGKTDTEKINNIKKSTPISFEPSLTKEAVDLITRLLKFEPRERIGIKEIFVHPWVRRYEVMFNINMSNFVQGVENKSLTVNESYQIKPYQATSGTGMNSNSIPRFGGNNFNYIPLTQKVHNAPTVEEKAARFTQTKEQQAEAKGSILDSVANFFGCSNTKN